MERSITPFG